MTRQSKFAKQLKEKSNGFFDDLQLVEGALMLLTKQIKKQIDDYELIDCLREATRLVNRVNKYFKGERI